MTYKNKYQREKEQYSVDGGTTWYDVTPANYRKGRLLEEGHNGDDCNEAIDFGNDYFTIEMLDDAKLVLARQTINSSSSENPLNDVYYSKNEGEWIPYNIVSGIHYNLTTHVLTVDSGDIIDVSQGDIIRWKAIGHIHENVIGSSYSDGYALLYQSFMATKNYNVYGNPKSLCYGDNFRTYDETGKYIKLYGLFCSSMGGIFGSVVDAENLILPLNMAESAFCRMFQSCKSLIKPPLLPATTLKNGCYKEMFDGCSSLTNAPTLPATTLQFDCYNRMFGGCTSLVIPPQLPATTLANQCYKSMFSGCTSLTTPPELTVTNLRGYCYYEMFRNCTSLEIAPYLPASEFTDISYGCYRGMFQGCTNLRYVPDFPHSTFTNQAQYIYEDMFNGCTSLTIAPKLSATTITEGIYLGMFQGCTSLTTPPQLPATTLAINCYQSMFNGCTSLTTAPQLPATMGAERCYANMFYNCRKLKYILCNLEYYNNDWTYNWLWNVNTTYGSFVSNCENADWESGVSGIPPSWSRTCVN